MTALRRAAVKTAAVITFVVIALFSVPVALLICGFATPSQFADTYYAELGPMYEKLRRTEGKKIVIVGTSSVAFGSDSSLIESQLRAAGADYTVCNFGLYGALGTKVMLDLAMDCIGEGDIVILAPELSEQPLSLYFSAAEMWRAADSHLSLLGGVSDEDGGSMIGAFASYVAEKMNFIRNGSPASPSGVYAAASFDYNCDMKNASRPYNTMAGGYDANNIIELDISVFSPDFISYVNEYAVAIAERGADMYFSFCPINEAAVADFSAETVASFWSELALLLDFPVISDLNDYIMEKEWFFDTNFHLNASGMTVRSINLLNDIKNQLGISAPTSIDYPEMPALPEHEGDDGEGDNSFAKYFEYAVDGDGRTYISGMTEEGRTLSEVVVPWSYGDVRVEYFAVDVFAGNTALRSVTLQSNIVTVYDGSFSGCSALERIVVGHEDPASLQIGYGLLEGTDADIFVGKDVYQSFIMNYTWGWYADRLFAIAE